MYLLEGGVLSDNFRSKIVLKNINDDNDFLHYVLHSSNLKCYGVLLPVSFKKKSDYLALLELLYKKI